MAMGDVGDDLSAAMLRELMNGTSSMLRFAMSHRGGGGRRIRDAYDRARGASERAIDREYAEGGYYDEVYEEVDPTNEELAEALDYRMFWAPTAAEQKELVGKLRKLGLDAKLYKDKIDGSLYRVKVMKHEGELPVAYGGEYAPLDMDNPDVAYLADYYSYESAKTWAAMRTACEAAREAATKDMLDVRFVENGKDNASIDFTVTRWDIEGNYLVDKLNAAGVGTRVTWHDATGRVLKFDENDRTKVITSDGKTIEAVPEDKNLPSPVKSVSVEFDARQTPLVETVVRGILNSKDKGVDMGRFPHLGQNMAAARRAYSEIIGQEIGKYRMFSMIAPTKAQAEAFSRVCEDLGVRVGVGEEQPDGTAMVTVNEKDLIAHELTFEDFCDAVEKSVEGIDISEEEGRYIASAAQAIAEEPLEAAPARKGVAAKIRGLTSRAASAAYSVRQELSIAVDRINAPKQAAEINRHRHPPTVAPTQQHTIKNTR